ncbi:MAG TPA: tetratricopeptide repeat protein, partial [Sphingomicrobium sp.]|nr:tetratricopeptide repeat protein [Sphingomicrobium sp.]
DQAITNLTQAIELNPADGTALESLGNAYTLKADYADAVTFYDKSLNLKPDPVVRTNLAYALLKLKRYREAVANYNSALKDDNATKDKALYGRGLAEQALGDIQDAARDMDAARRLDPNIAKEFE